MQLDKYKCIAHRGLHGEKLDILENTLQAFEKAVNHGYAIELDVQLTKDGKIVVFHDYSLNRMTGKNILLKDVTVDDLQKITLRESNETIPTLEDVLKLVDGKVSLLIEVKNEGRVGKLEHTLKDTLSKYNGEFMLESFNPFVVNYFKNNTDYICGILTCKSYNSLKMKLLGAIINLYIKLNIKKFDFIAYKLEDITKKFVLKAKKYNVPLMLWTISNTESYNKALEYSENIIFENILPKNCNNKFN